MLDRKVFLLLILTILCGFLVVIWYFFGAKKTPNPSIAIPNNPFGNTESRPGSEFINTSNRGTGNNGDVESERTPASERTLIQIWDKPVAGYAFVTREIIVEATSTATTTVGTSTAPKKLPKPIKQTVEYLLFVDRITGHIYGYNKNSTYPFQITNTTVPGIYDAYITQNGTKVFMRYLDKADGIIKTVAATVPSFIEGADPHQLSDIRSLQDNVSAFSVSKSSKAYSYMVPSFYGSSVYTINEKGAASVVTSPLKEWSLTYGGETPYITNKPSAYLEGSTYSLPNKTYVVGGKTGLMSQPNETGGLILSSMWSTSGLATFIFDKKTNSTRVLELATLASKCTWADASNLICGVPSSLPESSEGLPDDWFQGTVSFSDDIFLVDGNSGASSGLYNLSAESGSPFDVIRPLMNGEKSLFVFTNKQGGALWMINVARVLSPQ